MPQKGKKETRAEETRTEGLRDTTFHTHVFIQGRNYILHQGKLAQSGGAVYSRHVFLSDNWIPH